MGAEHIPASKWREWDMIAAAGRALIARRGRDITIVCYDAADTPKDSRRGRQRKVICLDTMEVYESVTVAGLAAKAGVRTSSAASRISAVCRGRDRTYLGKRYAFYDEYIKEGIGNERDIISGKAD